MQAWLMSRTCNFHVLVCCSALMAASSPAAKAQTKPVCPDQAVVAAAVKAVTDKFAPDTPPADMNKNRFAAVLVQPFKDCSRVVSSKTACRYALATRVNDIYVAWNGVQTPTIKSQIAAKEAEIKDERNKLTQLDVDANKARLTAEQTKTDADQAAAVKAEAAVAAQKGKIASREEARGRLNASLGDVSKSVSAVIEAQSRLLSADINSCLSESDRAASLCRQRRDDALYEMDRLLRQTPTVPQATLDKIIADANAFCTEIAKNINFDQRMEQDKAAQRTAYNICEWKADHWQDFIGYYYNLPKAERAIRIKSATFGDHVHGHICDAGPYFQQQCGQLPGDTVATAGSRSCIVTNLISRTTLCGYDPSPQADLTLRISYYCGHQLRRFTPDKGGGSIDVPFMGASGIGRVDLVCETEKFIKTVAVAEDATARTKRLNSLRGFFADPPCPLTIPKIDP